jgi:hypothetical protein
MRYQPKRKFIGSKWKFRLQWTQSFSWKSNLFSACDTEEEEDKQIEKLNIKTTRLMKWYRGLETCVAEALSK